MLVLMRKEKTGLTFPDVSAALWRAALRKASERVLWLGTGVILLGVV